MAASRGGDGPAVLERDLDRRSADPGPGIPDLRRRTGQGDRRRLTLRRELNGRGGRRIAPQSGRTLRAGRYRRRRQRPGDSPFRSRPLDVSLLAGELEHERLAGKTIARVSGRLDVPAELDGGFVSPVDSLRRRERRQSSAPL